MHRCRDRRRCLHRSRRHLHQRSPPARHRNRWPPTSRPSMAPGADHRQTRRLDRKRCHRHVRCADRRERDGRSRRAGHTQRSGTLTGSGKSSPGTYGTCHTQEDPVMTIKFVDLVAQNQEIHHHVESELAHLHRDASYVGGPQVAAFEAEFASYLGVKRVVGVGSGTDALRLALLAIGIGAGDEVITSAMTFIATAAAIFQTGARPVFVEVDRENGNMSARALRDYLENGRWSAPNGPRAILSVHLYGMPAPIHELQSIADEFDLKIVEDACQAHGARIDTPSGWVMMGTIGAAGCFSFYPGK